MAPSFFTAKTVASALQIPFPTDPRLQKMAKGLDFIIVPGDACLHQAIGFAKSGEAMIVTAKGEWLGEAIEQKWSYMAFRNEGENKVLFVMVEGDPHPEDPMSFRTIYNARKVEYARDGPQV